MAEVMASSASAWYSGSSLPTMRLDHSNMRWRSSWGTPSSSAMTWRGSSAEIWVTKSASPVLDHLVDDGVGGAVDALLEVAHHAGREALVDEAPVAGVQGRVHVEHHQALLGDLVLVELEGHGAPGGRAEALVVPVDGDAVLVAGDGPEAGAAGLVLPVHGVVVAQVGQIGVGDAVHVGPGIREIDRCDIGHGAHGLTAPLINRTYCPISRMVSPRSLRCQRSFGCGPLTWAERNWAGQAWRRSAREGSAGGVSAGGRHDGDRLRRVVGVEDHPEPGVGIGRLAGHLGHDGDLVWREPKTACRPRAIPVPMPAEDSLRQRSNPDGPSSPPACSSPSSGVDAAA